MKKKRGVGRKARKEFLSLFIIERVRSRRNQKKSGRRGRGCQTPIVLHPESSGEPLKARFYIKKSVERRSLGPLLCTIAQSKGEKRREGALPSVHYFIRTDREMESGEGKQKQRERSVKNAPLGRCYPIFAGSHVEEERIIAAALELTEEKRRARENRSV